MSDVNAVAVIHLYPNAGDAADRLISSLDEVAAAFGMDEPPSSQAGYIIEFWGVTPQKLREVVAGIQTDWRDVFYFRPAAD